MISYHPFWETLEKKNMSTYTLITKYGIAPTTIQRLRKFEYVSVRTVDELCQILNCRVENIIEVFPDDTDIKYIEELMSRHKNKKKGKE